LDSLCEWREKNRKGKLEIAISFVISKSHHRDIESMIGIMERYKIDLLQFQNYIPPSCTGEDTITTDDKEVIAHFNELANRLKPPFQVRLPNPIDVSSGENHCVQPWDLMEIDSDENTSPCCIIARNEKYGKFTGKEAWNRQSLQETRRIFAEGKKPFKYCNFCLGNQDPSKRIRIRKGT
ncbi:MAG: hypothetical protein KAT70_04730, partial [Thermoplasmata archaeon]|nr:hypothetical protein [Thermoplasmata archaeon]